MKISDIRFDRKNRMPLRIEQQPQSLLLEISDSLAAYEEPLRDDYKSKIGHFVDSSAIWYAAAVAKIEHEDGDPGNIRLLQIFVLSEQDADELTFGLMFRVDIDVDHGRGLKIDGGTLKIVEYGIGDVAL